MALASLTSSGCTRHLALLALPAQCLRVDWVHSDRQFSFHKNNRKAFGHGRKGNSIERSTLLALPYSPRCQSDAEGDQERRGLRKRINANLDRFGLEAAREPPTAATKNLPSIDHGLDTLGNEWDTCQTTPEALLKYQHEQSLLMTGFIALKGSTQEHRQQVKRQWEGLLAMARPQNFLPSVVLVLLGAWLASGRSADVFSRPAVWLVALLSGIIALTSMIANDVFDFRMGVDRVNGPEKPLCTGQVHPDDAELTAGCLYSAVVLGCCLLEPLSLRLLVGCGAVLTYIYTPFLKKITLVKNLVVAAVVASSVIAGGLVGGGLAGAWRTLAMGEFLFLTIVYREIIMDVTDIKGDSGAGIMTVPVRFGQQGGLLAACASLALAHVALVGAGPSSVAFSVAATAVLLPLYVMLLPLLSMKILPMRHLSKVVSISMIFIGGGLLLLSACL